MWDEADTKWVAWARAALSAGDDPQAVYRDLVRYVASREARWPL